MKTLIVILSIVVAGVGLVTALLAHPAFGVFRHVSKERIRLSPNYYDGMFQNQEPTQQFTGDAATRNGRPGVVRTLWRFMTDKDSVRFPSTPIEAVRTDLHSLPIGRDWVVWFGHSSYLFSLGGKRILVDPILKPEFPASLMLRAFAGTDIYRPTDLPEIDVLVITHEHWDHMDYATLRDIRTKVKRVVCPLGIADYLRYWHYSDDQIVEMDWYDQSALVNRQVQSTCLRSRQFSNRLLGKRN
ncbi:MAG: MBL fold metallo-hydrolase, partial [Paludibacteraceae bacterium]|nr:MBL fold metallo-hydrolase [Paludibacteraceae bacterium]